ncbi:MAG: hypothetical protein KDK38_00930 [Leptospiraceae bacterium]|nr:hypothetical protein [Leptospiraceae bacterium]
MSKISKILIILVIGFLSISTSSCKKSKKVKHKSTTSLNSHKVRTSGNSYTVMIYMVGSDLESDGGAASSDLDEMMTAGSTGQLNIIVQTGGATQWENENVDPDSVQRWKIYRDEMEEVQNLGTVNMGQSASLKDFIIWGTKNYPADRFVLILWNHGSGSIDGFGADELHDNDTITLPELEKAFSSAFKSTAKKFEIIGFDTCLMATLETAHVIAPYGEYLVASEELEPGHGWDYGEFLRPLGEETSMTGPELGKYIIDGFVKQATEQGNRDSITLSLIDLEKIPQLVSSLTQFVDTVWPDEIPKNISDEEADKIDDQIYAVANARSRAQDYGNSYEEQTFTDMVDLGDLVNKSNAELKLPQGDKVIEILESAVLYNVAGRATKNATGLTVYFPFKDKDAFERNLKIYETLNFPDSYKSFIYEYAQIMLEDNDPVDFEDEEPDELDENAEFVSQHEAEREKRSSSEKAKIYQAEIEDDKMDDLDKVYSVLMRFDEKTGREIYIGIDNDVWVEGKTAKLEWFAETITLDGHYVSFFVEFEDDEITQYAIPIKLNGREMDLSVIIENETGDYEILGAKGSVDAETHIADRRMYALKEGDKITPRYYYEEKNGNWGIFDGETFVLSKDYQIDYVPLKSGKYNLYFQTIDYAQNDSYSKPISIKVP